VMTDPEVQCPYGPSSDIDARYLAGTMPPKEAEAFEEHYFACDRCFAAVQRGTEIRAALHATHGKRSASSESQVIPIAPSRRRIAAWQPALAAAALVVVAVGIREARRPPTLPETLLASSNATRGAAPALAITSHATTTVLVAAWSTPPAARSYRVRLLGGDGSLLFERETADTSIMLPLELLRARGTKAPVYWEVQALDALRAVVASSATVQAQTSPGPP
jgi:hypothetical protein